MKGIDGSMMEALQLLRRLAEILEAEGEQNWIRGIRAAIAEGNAGEEGSKEKALALENMSSIYRSMHQGPGSFGDYFIWREDADERKEANREFEAVAKRLWNLLA